MTSVYNPCSKYTKRQASGIAVYHIKKAKVVATKNLPGHALFLPQTRANSVDRWEGHKYPRRDWNPGDVCFAPMGSDLRCDSSLLYEEIALCIEDRLFTAAAADHINYDAIDFRFADVTEKSTQLLSSAMVHIASAASFTEWPLLVETNAMALVVAVICALSPKATTAFRELPYGMGDSRKRMVTDFIEANLHRQISLKELAAVACLSPFHFSRLFKKRVGVSPLAYLAQRRVEAAKQQMRTKGATLAQVALDCGFASQSHFNTVFKTVTGSTPGQYRKATA